MARLKLARDGHSYLTQPYPVLDQVGRLETQFSTYQLCDGAEWLLREAGLREDSTVPREAFYALLIDGEIYNARRRGRVSFTSLPGAVRAEAEQKGVDLLPLDRLKDLFHLDQCRQTIEMYRAIIAAYDHPLLRAARLDSFACLSQASWYRLYGAGQE